MTRKKTYNSYQRAAYEKRRRENQAIRERDQEVAREAAKQQALRIRFNAKRGNPEKSIRMGIFRQGKAQRVLEQRVRELAAERDALAQEHDQEMQLAASKQAAADAVTARAHSLAERVVAKHRANLEEQFEDERRLIAAERRESEERQRRMEMLLRDRMGSYKHIADAWADWEMNSAERDARWLEYKPHPALAAAEVIRQRSRHAAKLHQRMKLAEYVITLYEYHFPWLVDFQDTEHEIEYADAPDYVEGEEDPARRQIAKAEWEALAPVERNQLALDRWIRSRRANAWLAGIDYERYIGYLREQDGYTVTQYGEGEGYGDLGRDVLAERDGVIEVIQCKRWGKRMGVIREKYVHQLVGTVLSLQSDHPDKTVTGTLTTTSTLSEVALAEAAKLGVRVEQEVPIGDYPRIKCNVARKTGERIYHLPFDQQYDATAIERSRGECLTVTCAEAEALGFRRAWRWHARTIG